MDLTVLVNRFTRLCEQKGYKPTVVCRESGAGKDFVSNIKDGRTPSIEKVHLIAEYLDCSIDYLLGRTSTPEIGGAALNSTESAMLTAFRELEPIEQGELIGRAREMAERHEKKLSG